MAGVQRLVLRSTVVAAAIGVVAGLIATQARQRGFAWVIVDALPLDVAMLAAVVSGSAALVLPVGCPPGGRRTWSRFASSGRNKMRRIRTCGCWKRSRTCL